MVVYFEPGDDMAKFYYALIVVIAAIGVLAILSYDTRFLPAVKRTQCVSAICSLIV